MGILSSWNSTVEGDRRMILNALSTNGWQHAESWPEMVTLISDVMDGLVSQCELGEACDAVFSMANLRYGPSPSPNNILRVALGMDKDFGALTWYVTETYPREKDSAVFDEVWITDNPNPPAVDPRVLADPWASLFYAPESCLPVDAIKAAVEEFARIGTGARPESVKWVIGTFGGQRIPADDWSFDAPKSDPVDFWEAPIEDPPEPWDAEY